LSWEETYENGKKIKAIQYYKGGNLASEIFFKNGKVVKGYGYTPQGKKSKLTHAHFHNMGLEY